THASGTGDGETGGEIWPCILLLLGVEQGDEPDVAERLRGKVLAYRSVSEDAVGMNLDLRGGDDCLLVGYRVTGVAGTRKGLRPSFSSAADRATGRQLYDTFLSLAHSRYPNVQAGRFGADMKVSLLNDGPVTFLLEVTATKSDRYQKKMSLDCHN